MSDKKKVLNKFVFCKYFELLVYFFFVVVVFKQENSIILYTDYTANILLD
jgi:hypothetical protein